MLMMTQTKFDNFGNELETIKNNTMLQSEKKKKE